MNEVTFTNRALVAGVGVLALLAQAAIAGPPRLTEAKPEVKPAVTAVHIFRMPEKGPEFKAELKKLASAEEAWRYYNQKMRVPTFQITRFMSNYAKEFKLDTAANKEFTEALEKNDKEMKDVLTELTGTTDPQKKEELLKKFRDLAEKGNELYAEFTRRNKNEIEHPEDDVDAWAPKGYLAGRVLKLNGPSSVTGGGSGGTGNQGVHLGSGGQAHDVARRTTVDTGKQTELLGRLNGTGKNDGLTNRIKGLKNNGEPVPGASETAEAVKIWLEGQIAKSPTGAEKAMNSIENLLRIGETIKDPVAKANFMKSLRAIFKTKNGAIATADQVVEMLGDVNSQEAKESLRGMVLMIGAVERLQAAFARKTPPPDAKDKQAYEKWEQDRDAFVGEKLADWIEMGREFREMVGLNTDKARAAWNDFVDGKYDGEHFTKEMKEALKDPNKRKDRDLHKSLCEGRCAEAWQLNCRIKG